MSSANLSKVPTSTKDKTWQVDLSKLKDPNAPSWKDNLKGYTFIAPLVILMLIFRVYPIFKTLSMSTYTKYNFIEDIVSARGWDNFQFIFQDKDFLLALRNTFIYVLGVIPLTIVIALIVALLLSSIETLNSFFRSIYFLPFVTSTVAVSLVFKWIFHSRYGLLNAFLDWLGLDIINWLRDPRYALTACIIMAIWKGLGLNIVLLLVGINSIDENYYKAARVDGANAWQRFWNITLPLLRPTLSLVSITGVINAFKVFDEIYTLFDGRPGPAKSTMTMVFYIYQKFYTEWEFGIATAAGVILFLIILVFTLIQFRLRKKASL